MYDVAILGAGASGLMTSCKLQNKKIVIIDKNDKIGEKIKVSGGAKCNITNKYMSSSHYLGDGDFIANVIDDFDEKALLKFLIQNNIKPKINEKLIDGSYFCQNSQDVIDMLKKLNKNTNFMLNTTVKSVSYEDEIFCIKCDNKTIKAKKLVISSGGMSFSSLGATDIGYEIAKHFGHSIKTLNPALVGFTVQKDQFWFKLLSGISTNTQIKIKEKTIKRNFLFTHKGCSGPAILNSSLYWEKGQININFAPNHDKDVPKRVRQLAKAQDNDVDLSNYDFAPAGTFGYSKAEVTKGGVCTSEIESDTMQSKLQKDLYFVGEVLDVTGELGGYNFQWAFSSAVVASQNINKGNI